MGKPFLIILELQQWSSSLAWFANKGKVKSNTSITHGHNHMGEFVVEGFFFLEVVTFFVTLRADLEDYFKSKT